MIRTSTIEVTTPAKMGATGDKGIPIATLVIAMLIGIKVMPRGFQ